VADGGFDGEVFSEILLIVFAFAAIRRSLVIYSLHSLNPMNNQGQRNLFQWD